VMVSGSSCDPDSSHLHLRFTRTDSDEMKSKLLPHVDGQVLICQEAVG
jgi:hypothetical protein